MKNKLLILIIVSTMTSCSDTSLKTISAGNYLVTINANTGARIVSFKFKNQELLLQQEIHPEFYGSTLWPSPQSVWNWPPPKTLDIEPYQVEKIADGFRFTSQNDSLTGLQFNKRILLADGVLTASYQAINVSKKTIRAALWEVTRVKGGLTFFPLATLKAPADSLSNLKSVETINNVLWYTFDEDEVKNEAQKLFANGEGGWLAHIENGMCFIKVFDNVNISEIPPQQGEIELYVNDKATYVELENHSVYQTLAPGEKINYTLRWFYFPLPPEIIVRAGEQKLINIVHKHIKNLK
ncbi:DUF4380 domain-containing protein [Aquimarina sp. U1-2]|uniref:DUF4380 domain-containing protein n=1 Tax=Aquimarina sp. U1-2 TaxID=2823141 RepID=UPI001AECF6CC|nr:DUF4380 domain-containing protein [Aquimarina sp. U1-2]MBP2832892.1 DUF4380 domain-containing protein [Aquimarina sp. U1-2]